MFKEILYVIPKLGTEALAEMERALNSRFVRVAKKFGKGLSSVISGGGIVAAGIAMVNRLLNPLKEIQEAVDKTLNQSSDISTQAKQFGGNAGELAKLHAFGAAKGVDAGTLDMLIGKFQSSVVQATQNPGEHSAVRQFVGQKDMVSAFFDFIQNLQKLNDVQQVQVQEEVFGAKQVLKMSEFLHADFGQLADRFKDISTAELAKANDKLSGLSDIDKANFAFRGLNDIIEKAKVITPGVVSARDQAEGARLERENTRLASYEKISAIDQKMEKMQASLEQITTDVLTNIPVITGALDTAIDLLKKSVDGWKMIFKLLQDSPLMRLFGKGK